MKIRNIVAAALLALAAISLPALAPAQSTVAETLARFGRFIHNDGMIGVVVDYALPTPPPGWLMCYGKALASDTPYQALRDKLIAAGSPYGSSGGNPLLPDARGRTTAGKDNMGGASAGRLAAYVAGSTLGGTGGSEGHTLTTAQMPWHTHGWSDPGHSHTVNDPGHAHAVGSVNSSASAGAAYGKGASSAEIRNTGSAATGIWLSANTTGINFQGEGGSQAHPNVQPTIVLNKIIFAGL